MASRIETLTPSYPKKTSQDYLRYSLELLNVSTRNVVGLAVTSTVALFSLFWIIKLIGLTKIESIGWVVTIFTERSIIQHASTLAFFAGFWFLVLKLPKISKESQGFDLLDFPEMKEFPIGAEGASKISGLIKELPAEQRQLAVIRRVDTALQRLVHTNATGEVHDVLNTMSDIDREIADASYKSVKFSVWFIPVAGFLGTVLGISQAITGFASIVNSRGAIDLNTIKPILADATYNLGVAFDTTLLALALSSILVMVMFYAQRREEVFLSAVDEFCVSEIVNRLYLQDPGTTQLLEGIDNLADRVVGSIGTLTDKIGDDLKTLAGSLEQQDERVVEKLIDSIRERFEQFIDTQTRHEDAFQARLDELMTRLTSLIDKGQAMEEFVAGLGQVAGLKNILNNHQETLAALQSALADEHKGTRASMHENRQAIENLLKILQAAFDEQQQLSRTAIDQNRQAIEELLPPVKELSTGIKIRVGE